MLARAEANLFMATFTPSHPHAPNPLCHIQSDKTEIK